jgi:hypothetical protein
VSISDERLVQLQFEVSAIKPSRHISMSSADRVDLLSIFSELQSFRAAAKVRTNSEGDGEAKRVPHEVALAGFYEAQKAEVKAMPLYDQCCAIYQAMRNTALASIPATGGEKV